jgi:hypothetical protein
MAGVTDYKTGKEREGKEKKEEREVKRREEWVTERTKEARTGSWPNREHKQAFTWKRGKLKASACMGGMYRPIFKIRILPYT